MTLSFRRTTPFAAATLAVVFGLVAGGQPSHGATAQSPIAMYPIGGTSAASPSTQISFRGTKKGPLKDITVIGAKSGVHRGRFAYHSDGQGVSFLPSHPFRDGELVTVRTSAPLVRAKSGAVTFRILTRPSAKDLARIEKQFHSDPEGNPAGAENFRTRSDLKPPGLTIERNDAGASSDPIFLAVKGGPGQDGPTIRDAQGHLIWFRRVKPPFSPYDFRTQAYQGKPVLTWWQGKVLAGKGSGYGVMLDSQYRLVTHVSAGNGFKMDQHEFEITPQGTAFINVYEPVVWDLTKVGGPRNGIAWDSIVQEIDIKTGLVLFEWHSLAHVSVRLGTFPVREGSGFPYDPFHVNSVSVEGDGSLILSARNTNALFRIDRRAGRIIWRLGGKRSDFTLGPGTRADRPAPGRPPARRHDHRVRQRRQHPLPEPAGQAESRRHAERRRGRTHRFAGARVPPRPPGAVLAQSGEHAAPAQHRRVPGLGRREPVHDRVRAGGR